MLEAHTNSHLGKLLGTIGNLDNEVSWPYVMNCMSHICYEMLAFGSAAFLTDR